MKTANRSGDGPVAGDARLQQDHPGKRRQNYRGHALDEIVQLLGSPERCDDAMGARNYLWGDEQRAINVSFVAGSVLLFSSSNLQ